MTAIAAPIGMLAELTHRCPLHCPYCSNPVALDRRSAELDTATWLRVFSEAARMGVAQVHLSAIEEEAFDQLPPLVYVRGFLTELAKFLRLDPAQVARTYLRRAKDLLEIRG